MKIKFEFRMSNFIDLFVEQYMRYTVKFLKSYSPNTIDQKLNFDTRIL